MSSSVMSCFVTSFYEVVFHHRELVYQVDSSLIPVVLPVTTETHLSLMFLPLTENYSSRGSR